MQPLQDGYDAEPVVVMQEGSMRRELFINAHFRTRMIRWDPVVRDVADWKWFSAEIYVPPIILVGYDSADKGRDPYQPETVNIRLSRFQTNTLQNCIRTKRIIVHSILDTYKASDTLPAFGSYAEVWKIVSNLAHSHHSLLHPLQFDEVMSGTVNFVWTHSQRKTPVAFLEQNIEPEISFNAYFNFKSKLLVHQTRFERNTYVPSDKCDISGIANCTFRSGSHLIDVLGVFEGAPTIPVGKFVVRKRAKHDWQMTTVPDYPPPEQHNSITYLMLPNPHRPYILAESSDFSACVGVLAEDSWPPNARDYIDMYTKVVAWLCWNSRVIIVEDSLCDPISGFCSDTFKHLLTNATRRYSWVSFRGSTVVREYIGRCWQCESADIAYNDTCVGWCQQCGSIAEQESNHARYALRVEIEACKSRVFGAAADNKM